ncbi:MAG TPA: hydroxyacid dehydrogenase [Bdellovibrionota bacterium]|nr:hydroxyacid dehydrogenase [Bdellovibrionota bacterium]
MAKTKILITDGMAKEGVDILKSNPDFEIDLRKETSASELAGIIGDYQSIVIRSATTLTGDLIRKATSMKLIVRAGAGVDTIEVPVATELKIPVMNTASANSLAAAEQTIALMFAMLRQLPQAHASMAAGKWDRKTFVGFEATGKVMGVIGLGNIGRIVAEKAVGLGMKVVGFDPFIQTLSQVPGKLSRMDESVTVVKTVDEVLRAADILTLHVPKNKQTANLINADSIGNMKKGSFVINCSRGGIVDEKAVIAAIDSGHLRGAAFDVFEKEPPEFPTPLANHPKIVVAPHLGASTNEAQERVALTAASQMVAFFKSGDRTGVIN